MSARRLLASRLHACHDKTIPGARHPHVKESTSFLELQFVHDAVARNRYKLLVLDADDVYPRELEPLGGVKREEIHAILSFLSPVVLRQDCTLQKCADLFGQVSIRARLDESPQSPHCLRIALVRRAFCAQPFHQFMTAEQSNQIVDTGQIGGSTSCTLRRIAIEALTMAAERIRGNKIEDLPRLVAEGVLVAERQCDAELVEKVYEC